MDETSGLAYEHIQQQQNLLLADKPATALTALNGNSS